MTCYRVTPFSGTISPEWVAQVRAVYPEKRLMPQVSTNNQELFANEFR